LFELLSELEESEREPPPPPIMRSLVEEERMSAEDVEWVWVEEPPKEPVDGDECIGWWIGVDGGGWLYGWNESFPVLTKIGILVYMKV